MADSIEDKFSIKPKLKKSGGGVFEIEIDGKLVFSKKETGRFPDAREIFEAIKKH